MSRKFKFSFVLTWLLLMMFPSHSHGGGEVGNGSDHHPEEYQSAWFLGKSRTIHACLSMSPSFGIDMATAAHSIHSAFSQWIDYVHDHQVLRVNDRQNELFAQGNDDWAYAESLEVNQFCTGTEDLHIYLGVENEEVRAGEAEFSDPLAFTKRIKFDQLKGWSKGVLWVRNSASGNSVGIPFPDWGTPHSLDYVLLHEMGHIFGNPHVPETIMREEIADYLRDLYVKRHETVLPAPTIDQSRKLFTDFPAGGVYVPLMTVPNTTRATFAPVLARIVGRDIDLASLKCSAEVKPVPSSVFLFDTVVSANLLCQDQLGFFSVEIKENESLGSEKDQSPLHIFKRTRENSSQLTSIFQDSSEPDYRLASVSLADRTVASAFIQFIRSGPAFTVNLFVIEGGQQDLIFSGVRRSSPSLQ